MFKKLNIRTLYIVFAVTLAVVLISKFINSRKGERTFKTQLVSIDSAGIAAIYLYPKAEEQKEIRLTLTGGGRWQAEFGNIKSDADTGSVKGLISELLALKSQRLAATSKSQWKEYNVDDSTGTRIKVMTTGNSVAADIMIGRISFSQQTQSATSYIRLHEEENVYAVEGFLPMSCNQKFEQWRNKVLIKGNKDNWTQLTYTYPGDSSFTISKSNKKWMVNGVAGDSSKIDQYLNTLSYQNGSGFIDNVNFKGQNPIYNLKIEGNNLPAPILVRAFASDTVIKFVLNSSLNPDSYFNGTQSKLTENIFTSKAKLMSSDTTQKP